MLTLQIFTTRANRTAVSKIANYTVTTKQSRKVSEIMALNLSGIRG